MESRDQQRDVQANASVRVLLPFKDQRSAEVLRRQLFDLGKKINSDLRLVFTSKKIADDIKVAEAKPPLINLLGSLSKSVSETRRATGSGLISLLTRPHTTTFTLLS